MRSYIKLETFLRSYIKLELSVLVEPFLRSYFKVEILVPEEHSLRRCQHFRQRSNQKERRSL